MVILYNKIFITTLPRSGSTILGQILAGHKDVCHLGESMYWELLNPKNVVCSCGKNNCDFLKKIYLKIYKKHAAKPLLRLWQIIDKKYWPSKPRTNDSIIPNRKIKLEETSIPYWVKRSGHALDLIINIYKQYTNSKVFVDNSKLHHIGLHLATKKDWGIIILLRDPRAIMSSYKNAGIRKGDMRTVGSVLPFCFDFIKVADQLRNKPNICIIKYEDLCNNPQFVIRHISKFIGIKYSKVMLDFKNLTMRKRGHVLKGNRLLQKESDFHLVLDNSWRTNLTKNELHKLKNQADIVKLYKSFGYNI